MTGVGPADGRADKESEMHKWIDHIVVRVEDLDQGMRDYEDKLGMKTSKGPDDMPELGDRKSVV